LSRPAWIVTRDLRRLRPRRALAGYGLARWNPKDTHNAHLRWSDVAIRPEPCRRGLGRALLAKVVQWCDGPGDDIVFNSQTTSGCPYR
jgi:GNAT superfamily N-acetyltransferase